MKEGLDCRVIPYNGALPSTSSMGVPPSSSEAAAAASPMREGDDVGSTPSLSSFSSDYLLSLSP